MTAGLRKYVSKRMDPDQGTAWIRKNHILRGTLDLKRLDENPAKLEATRRAVAEGWDVYDELWKEAHHFRDASGVGPFGRIKLAREKKKWEESGALENVGAAQKALKARQQGDDLEQLFQQRRKEVKQAEQPKKPGIEQDETSLEGQGVKVQEQAESSTIAAAVDGGEETIKEDRAAGAKMSRADSEATAVDSAGNSSGKKAEEQQTGLSGGAAKLDAAQDDLGKDRLQAQHSLGGNQQVQV
jgi:hypothetical protein